MNDLALIDRTANTQFVHGTRYQSFQSVDSAMARLLDVALCTLAMIFLLPLLLVVTAAVFVSNPGPIFFAHRRVGRGGRTFYCYKFRTMIVNAEERLEQILAGDVVRKLEWERDHKLKDDPRITSIGLFLRRSSLDELPQLWNVLRGDMSIVGPRPIVQGEISRYGRYFADYCKVQPGITGIWQVSGRNDVSYRRRVAMDITYSRTRSLGLNVRIMAMTVPSVLMARGSY